MREIGDNFEIIQSNFQYLKSALAKRNITKVDAILFDLGVSSPQLDEKDRGFSFHQDAPLDMRMDRSQSLTAKEVVNTYSYQDLVRIFKEYGEEKFATSIARAIERQRKEAPLETTLELAELIKSAVPEKYRREKHPARKVFQAIRIEVNRELEVCEIAVRDALDCLDVDGRLCVITFHSLEDKIVKNLYKIHSTVKKELMKLPVIPEEYQPKYKVVATVVPTEKELSENKRARSAKLRVIARIKK